MAEIRSWVVGVCAVALASAVIAAIVPKNSPGRIAAMYVGMLMTAVIISPIKTLDTYKLSGYMSDIQYELSECAEKSEEKMRQLTDNIIEDRVEAYILERSKTECEVEVLCKDGVLCSASVSGTSESEVKKVSEMINRECGILQIRESLKNDGNV
ncbi:MAG: hypothetical protein IKU65_04970 [Oscillospiraceae bacterium]|nr:hypothetical protein [Oscillospiraceae bacterium]